MVLDESDKQITKSVQSFETCAWSFLRTVQKIGFWLILMCKLASLCLCVCCVRWCREQTTGKIAFFYGCAYYASIALGMYLVVRICIDIITELTN